MTSSGYKSISRIDSKHKRTHGWFVRIKFKGRELRKWFGDAAYDGKPAALEAAVDWRDETERDLAKPRTERRVILDSGRNRTGAIGVSFDERKQAYVAAWSSRRGQVQRAWVPIRKYGRRRAYQRACRIRAREQRKAYRQ